MNILSIGSNLNLELSLSLSDVQYELLGLKFNEIETLNDLKKYFESENLNSEKEKLMELISLRSEDFLFNCLLFINRANKTKTLVEYLIPFSPKYPDELMFMSNIVKTVTENNYILIEDFNLLDIKPKIVFYLKLLDDNDEIKKVKKFIVTEENHFKSDDNNNNNPYNGELFESISYSSKTDYLLTTVNELYNCKKNNEEEVIKFIDCLQKKFPKMKVCIHYDGFMENSSTINTAFIDYIQNLLERTHIYFFEKKDFNDFITCVKEHQRKDKNKNNKNNKKYGLRPQTISLEDYFITRIKGKPSQKLKVGFIMDNLKTLNVIQQDPGSQLLLYQTNVKINLLGEKKDNYYIEVVDSNYTELKSVYLGSLLSRFLNLKSFDTCFHAAEDCTKKVIEIFAYKMDMPCDQKFYEVVVKKKGPNEKTLSQEKIQNHKLEEHFVLDCTNVTASKIQEYNSLYDDNCSTYFTSFNNRKHLLKQGFINKHGMILVDPDKNGNMNFCGQNGSKNKNSLVEQFHKENNSLMKIKEKNNIMKLQLSKLSAQKQSIMKNFNYQDVEAFSARHHYELKENKMLPSLVNSLNASGCCQGNNVTRSTCKTSNSKKIKPIENNKLNKINNRSRGSGFKRTNDLYLNEANKLRANLPEYLIDNSVLMKKFSQNSGIKKSASSSYIPKIPSNSYIFTLKKNNNINNINENKPIKINENIQNGNGKNEIFLTNKNTRLEKIDENNKENSGEIIKENSKENSGNITKIKSEEKSETINKVNTDEISKLKSEEKSRESNKVKTGQKSEEKSRESNKIKTGQKSEDKSEENYEDFLKDKGSEKSKEENNNLIKYNTNLEKSEKTEKSNKNLIEKENEKNGTDIEKEEHYISKEKLQKVIDEYEKKANEF